MAGPALHRHTSRRRLRNVTVALASWVLALSALGGAHRGLAAQILAGRVLEADANASVLGAEIRLLDDDGAERAAAVTDSTGWFQVRLPAAGTYTVAVRHIAYADFDSEPLELARAQTMTVEIRMGRGAIPLEPLVITARRIDRGRLAGFRERSASNPFGRYVTREEIDRRPATSTSDYFRVMSSVRVVPVNRNGNPNGMITHLVLMRGGAFGMCSPTIYLDGVRIDQSSSFPIDDLLQPGILEGIEVYTMAGAPAEYLSSNNCGVILFWTREGEPGGRGGWLRHAIGGAATLLLLLLAF
jgi:hypothetical protein